MSFTGTYSNTIVLDIPSVQNPATVATTGFVQVTNADGIFGPTSTGIGIVLEGGGAVTNGASGFGVPLISGAYNGIFAGSGPATIVNYGRIEAPGSIFNGGRAANVGVFLGAGGSVQNGSA